MSMSSISSADKETENTQVINNDNAKKTITLSLLQTEISVGQKKLVK